MQSLKLQLDTPPHLNRDVSVELVHAISGKVTTASPFLDGSVAMRNVEPGMYRLRVKHPNQLFDLVDRPIKVQPDRPTFVPISVPRDLFTFTGVQDIPDADLGPVQAKLQTAEADAEAQSNKRPGQPIFADDWNKLAGAVSDVAKATGDATRLVAPLGHDHPELVAKIDELQANLQRFYDVFAGTIVNMQRQIQVLHLRQQAEDALSDANVTDTNIRDKVLAPLKELDVARDDKPAVYTRVMARVGTSMAEELANVVRDLPAGTPEPGTFANLASTVMVMAATPPAATYEAELSSLKKVEKKSGGGGFTGALKSISRKV